MVLGGSGKGTLSHSVGMSNQTNSFYEIEKHRAAGSAAPFDISQGLVENSNGRPR
jgi:hypothetical protein